jgi:Cdc6-like AAA superfamily ATPase
MEKQSRQSLMSDPSLICAAFRAKRRRKKMSDPSFDMNKAAHFTLDRLRDSFDPPTLRCREEHLEWMLRHIRRGVEKGSGRLIILAGAPGTGKTACARHIESSLRKRYGASLFERGKVKVSLINCMQFTNLKDFCLQIGKMTVEEMCRYHEQRAGRSMCAL